MIEERRLDHDLELADNSEFLSVFYPVFDAEIGNEAFNIFSLLTCNISLVGGGMGGVNFRESKDGIMNIFERNGYCPVIMQPFIDEFEGLIMIQYNKSIEDKK